ncbi:MAG: hypothetical protein ISP56_00975 [Flavobacteriaceae bacterium]|nr:hypothetical protein [Flavobacteriaceae bacterium]
MLKNVSYNDDKTISEINDFVGKPFSIFERIKLGGIGSSKLLITKTDSIINNLLELDHNINYCNIEIRPKGIIIRFRSLLDTYALIIPYFKLKLFKGKSNEYSVYIDKYYIKVIAKKKGEHNFFKKILNLRISN